jgi:hypothetical protein
MVALCGPHENPGEGVRFSFSLNFCNAQGTKNLISLIVRHSRTSCLVLSSTVFNSFAMRPRLPGRVMLHSTASYAACFSVETMPLITNDVP